MHTEANAAGLMATKALSFAESQQSTKPAGVDAITKEFLHHQQWRKHFLTQLRKRKSLKDGTAFNNHPKETTMKTPDYETIAYMFVHAAEALFMMAARQKVEPVPASIYPKRGRPVGSKNKPKLEAKPQRKGKTLGAKHWSKADTATLLNMRAKGHKFSEIGEAVGRSAHSVEVKASRIKASAA
jgi:hypothetical protein